MVRNGDLIKITDNKMLFWDEHGGLSWNVPRESAFGLVLSNNKMSALGTPLIEFLWEGKVISGFRPTTQTCWFEVINATEG